MHRAGLEGFWAGADCRAGSGTLHFAFPVAEGGFPAPSLGCGNSAADAVHAGRVEAGAGEAAEVAGVAAAQIEDLGFEVDAGKSGVGPVDEGARGSHFELYVLGKTKAGGGEVVHGALDEDSSLGGGGGSFEGGTCSGGPGVVVREHGERARDGGSRVSCALGTFAAERDEECENESTEGKGAETMEAEHARDSKGRARRAERVEGRNCTVPQPVQGSFARRSAVMGARCC